MTHDSLTHLTHKYFTLRRRIIQIILQYCRRCRQTFIEGDLTVRRVLMSLFMSLYTAFIENRLVLFGFNYEYIHCISSRFFEIQPNKISSQVSTSE